MDDTTDRSVVPADFVEYGTDSTAVSYMVNLAIIPFITYFILAEGDVGIKSVVEKIGALFFN